MLVFWESVVFLSKFGLYIGGNWQAICVRDNNLEHNCLMCAVKES